MRRAGREPGSRLEYARLIEVDEGLAERTHLAAGAPLFEMRRIRFADDEPVAIETAYVNYAICPGIEAHDFAVESLYDVLAADYGVHVGHGQERISIARATPEEASLLQVEEGSPVFFERAIECQADGVPVEYLKAVILPSRYRFASNGCENGSKAQGGEELMAHLVGDPAAGGSEPRYLSIRKTIRDRIADGTYPAGTAIPFRT